jgi:hypothetical protein
MSQADRNSNLVLAAFATFLIGFIAMLALDRAGSGSYACELDAARTAGARLAANPSRALETLRTSFSSDVAGC